MESDRTKQGDAVTFCKYIFTSKDVVSWLVGFLLLGGKTRLESLRTQLLNRFRANDTQLNLRWVARLLQMSLILPDNVSALI